MRKKEIYEIAGVACGQPAGSDGNGGVRYYEFGLVALREMAYSLYPQFIGKVGYYDDEGDEDDGAIVYWGVPFVDDYHELPLGALRPATPEECAAYILRGTRGTPTAQG